MLWRRVLAFESGELGAQTGEFGFDSLTGLRFLLGAGFGLLARLRLRLSAGFGLLARQRLLLRVRRRFVQLRAQF